MRIDNPTKYLYQPKPKLYEAFDRGRLPGISLPPLFQVLNFLGDSEYRHAHQLFEKGLDALGRGDLQNAVKDAVSALESVALIVAGRSSGTLGDVIKDMRANGALPRPLDKACYTSEEPGVRHGGTRSSEMGDAMAVFVINLSAAAICFLAGGDLHS